MMKFAATRGVGDRMVAVILTGKCHYNVIGIHSLVEAYCSLNALSELMLYVDHSRPVLCMSMSENL
jgi:hypothetical protein